MQISYLEIHPLGNSCFSYISFNTIVSGGSVIAEFGYQLDTFWKRKHLMRRNSLRQIDLLALVHGIFMIAN